MTPRQRIYRFLVLLFLFIAQLYFASCALYALYMVFNIWYAICNLLVSYTLLRFLRNTFTESMMPDDSAPPKI